MGGDIGDTRSIQLGSERELYKYINHHAVVTFCCVRSYNFIFYFLSLTFGGRRSVELGSFNKESPRFSFKASIWEDEVRMEWS